MDNHYTVYVHISPSGKRYYGLTSRDVKKRWLNGKGYIRNEHFYRAIEKYGWDAFAHDIVATGLTKEEACALEERLIAEHHTQDPLFGYNISAGGEANLHSQASKDKISKANKGRAVSDETRRKLSKVRTGTPSGMKGHKLSDEQKDRISASRRGKPHPHKAPDSMKKKVLCNGVTYDSIKECGEFYGVSANTISRWLLGDDPIPLEFVQMGLQYADTKTEYVLVEDTNHKAVEYDGIIFDTVNKVAEYLGVEHHTVSRWLNGSYKIPDRIKSGNIHYVTTYHYVVKNIK